MDWKDVVLQKIIELELIAQWASAVNLGHVRDSVREAIAYLKEELTGRCESPNTGPNSIY